MPPTLVTLADYVDAFLAVLPTLHGEKYEEPFVPRVRVSHTQKAIFWRRTLGSEKVSSINRIVINNVLSNELPNAASGTLNNYLKTFNLILKTGATLVGQDEPTFQAKQRRVAKTRVPIVSPFDLNNYLKACAMVSELPDPRATVRSMFYPAVVVAIGTGLRQSEQYGLRVRDVDLTGGHEKVIVPAEEKDTARRTKTLTAKTVSLAGMKNVTDILAMLLEGKQRGDLVFTTVDNHGLCASSFTRSLELAARESGLDHIHWHTFRHTCATYLAMLGGEWTAPRIQYQLGHGSLATTQHYINLVDAEYRTETARKIVEEFFGLSPLRLVRGMQ